MDLAKVLEMTGGVKDLKEFSHQEIIEILEILNELEKRDDHSGFKKWFVDDGPYSLAKLPKHAAVIAATKKYREVLVLGANRAGKALPVWENVITPTGSRLMGELAVGDEVVGSTGFPCKVVGVFPQGVRDIFKVRFSDGSEVHADGEHLWKVRNTKKGKDSKFEILTTNEISKTIDKRWSIPERPVTEYAPRNVPIDPYLLGLLLGDGGLTGNSVSFSTTDEFLLEQFSKLTEMWGLDLRSLDYCTYRARCVLKDRQGYPFNPLLTSLRELGCDTLSVDKKIPEIYSLNSSAVRLELLKGLMDTDGYIDTKGRSSFYTSSERLAAHVQWIARSLGIKATLSNKKTHLHGKEFNSFVVYMGRTDFPCFKLPRKLERWSPTTRPSRLVIESVEYFGQDECVCIKVDAQDELFLANDFILTHNTSIGAYISAVLATGLYPDNWEGVRYDHPVHIWAVGKTGQTTRDTVQKALMGDIGSFGTGMIPKDCVGKTVALPGTPNALDSVMVKHVSGGWSTIGFKSYKQEVHSFFGTAKHLVWLDEPCPELIYNECLIRTMTTAGKIVHTITPKDGLTRLLADFLSDCDLLAGTEALPGLDVAKALIDKETAGKDE